jgi:hypothetical protein
VIAVRINGVCRERLAAQGVCQACRCVLPGARGEGGGRGHAVAVWSTWVPGLTTEVVKFAQGMQVCSEGGRGAGATLCKCCEKGRLLYVVAREPQKYSKMCRASHQVAG